MGRYMEREKQKNAGVKRYLMETGRGGEGMVGKWMARKKKTNCLNAEPVGNNGREVQEMTRKGEKTEPARNEREGKRKKEMTRKGEKITASTPSQRGIKWKWESKGKQRTLGKTAA
jgi:hypothetical protein